MLTKLYLHVAIPVYVSTEMTETAQNAKKLLQDAACINLRIYKSEKIGRLSCNHI